MTIIGTVIAAFGVYVAYGGLFVPPVEILRNPEPIPMPERLVAFWLVAIGGLLIGWSWLRK